MKIKVVKHDRNYLGPDYLDPLLLYTVLQPIITNRLLCGPPTILPPNDLPSSMQLQRSINTGPNPQWCKLSFQIKVVHFEERGVLSPQVWAAPPPHTPHTLPRLGQILSATLPYLFRKLTCVLQNSTSGLCLWEHLVCVCSVCVALFAHSQEMSPCKENSQLKLCVCHITESDWTSREGDKKMRSYICSDKSLSHLMEEHVWRNHMTSRLWSHDAAPGRWPDWKTTTKMYWHIRRLLITNMSKKNMKARANQSWVCCLNDRISELRSKQSKEATR